jgi:K(+)-stimulated pyrophosphate-energized sodium pump
MSQGAMFGLLAVELAESFKAQGSEITGILTVVFLAVGLYFVWRSFYGMRIQGGA